MFKICFYVEKLNIKKLYSLCTTLYKQNCAIFQAVNLSVQTTICFGKHFYVWNISFLLIMVSRLGLDIRTFHSARCYLPRFAKLILRNLADVDFNQSNKNILKWTFHFAFHISSKCLLLGVSRFRLMKEYLKI